MEVKTNNRWLAIRAFINTWLKDQSLYCNNCGLAWQGEVCCENPQIGRNIDHAKGVIKQNKMIRQTRLNQYASTKDKSIRWGISLPPRLFADLERYFRKNYHEKLFRNKKDIKEFAKEFQAFAIPEKL